MSVQHVEKSVAKCDVNDEVDGRVDHLQTVAHVDQKELGVRTCVVLIRVSHLHAASRCLAEHEHDDDDNHDQRDVVVVLAPSASVLRVSVPRAAICVAARARWRHLSASGDDATVAHDHARVEDRQKCEREEEGDAVVHDVSVDCRVLLAASQCRASDLLRVEVGTQFEEARQVVDDWRHDHACDDAPHVDDVGERGDVVRQADGNEARRCDGDREPDGCKLRHEEHWEGCHAHERDRPQVDAQIREHLAHRVVQKPQEEEAIVGHRQTAQLQRRNRTADVTRVDEQRERVSGEAEHADDAEHEADVDEAEDGASCVFVWRHSRCERCVERHRFGCRYEVLHSFKIHKVLVHVDQSCLKRVFEVSFLYTVRLP